MLLGLLVVHGGKPSHIEEALPLDKVALDRWDRSDVSSPWPWCDSDDDIVADLLAASVESLLGLGGWLHPAARIVARRGQLRVECDAPDGEPLVVVPRDAFLPVGRMSWDSGAESLALADPGSVPSGTDYGLLLTQIGLHNACGKIPWIASTHPVLSAGLSDDLVDAVRAFRPSFRSRQPPPASLFWSDRCFRLPLESDVAEPVALPVLDLLDHHPQGAVGSWDGTAFSLEVAHVGGGSECFMDYGLQRDAIGMAVVYGFADLANPWAHSAPLEYAVPGVGTVQVLARGRARTGQLLPPVVRGEADRWVISRLSFGAEDPVDALAVATGQPRERCRAVAGAVARAHLPLTDRVVAAAAASTDPAAVILGQAAQRHRDIVANYAEA